MTERTNTIPSSDSDRQRLAAMVSECVDIRTMMAAEAEKLKDAKDTVLEEFPITGKLLNQLINFEFKQNFNKVSHEQDEIQQAYMQLKGITE